MTAFEALKVARQAGIQISINGDRLVLEAPKEPPAEVIRLLEQHKPGIIVLLRLRGDPWSTADWKAYFDEQAAITEFDHGLRRPAAEARAFEFALGEWLNRNPVYSASDTCLGCAAAGRPNDDLLPVGLGGGEVWLHLGCSAAWRAGRIAEAVKALALMGIAAPPGSSVTSEESSTDQTGSEG